MWSCPIPALTRFFHVAGFVLLLFVVWLVRDKRFSFKDIHFLPWDKYLGWFVVVGLFLGLLFGSFRLEAVKAGVIFSEYLLFYIWC